MKISKEAVFVAILVILAIGGLVVRNFPFTQGNLDKDMPPTITSFDLFAGTSYAKYIYDSEDARYNPPYRVMGVENSLTAQPVHYFLFIASFTKLTTLNAYQTTQLMTHLVSILVILVVFVLIKRAFGWKIGLIAAALAAFPQANWLFQLFIGFQYDQHSFLFVPAILIFLIAFFNKQLDSRQTYLAAVLIGLFGVNQWLSHFVEFFLYLPLFGIMWVYFGWKNGFKKEHFVLPIIAAIVFLPFFIYFYPITGEGHLSSGFSENLKQLAKFGAPSPYPSYWPAPRFSAILNVLGALGVFFIGSKIFKKQLDSNQKFLLIFAAYLIAVGLSNYIGIDANRVSRQLFNGLSLLTMLPAIGIYLVYNFITSNKAISKYSNVLFILLLAVILVFTAPKTYAQMSQIDQGSFVDDLKWQSIQWIRDRTPYTSNVFYLNGFFHEFAMFGERPYMEGIVLPNPEAMEFNFQRLCTGNWTPAYAGHWGNGQFVGKGTHPEVYARGSGLYLESREGFSKFTYVEPFNYPDAKRAFVYNRTISIVPLKFFDFVVVQHTGTQLDPCVGFFINQSMDKGHELIWYNPEMAILRINKEAKP